MASRLAVLRRTVVVTLVTGVLVLAACSDDGSDDSGGGPSTVDEVQLHPLQDDPDIAGLVGGSPPEVLGELLGDRPIVLNFFASWCAPCIAEMPDFETVHQDLGDHVIFIGMAYMDGDARAREIVETTGVTYPTFSDPDGDALLFFESIAMPTTVFIAPDGDILMVRGGELNESQLRDEINDRFWAA